MTDPVVDAIGAQLADLGVRFRAVDVADDGGELSLPHVAAARAKGGARVVVWVDQAAPDAVWFLAASSDGPKTYRRRFVSGASPTTGVEQLAQICRATVQVLVGTAPAITTQHPDEGAAVVAAVRPDVPPEAAAVSSSPLPSESDASVRRNGRLLDLTVAHASRAFSKQNLWLSGIYLEASLRIGPVWRVSLGAAPYLQEAEDTAGECVRAQIRQYPIGLSAEAAYPLGRSRLSMGPSARLVASVDRFSYQWGGPCSGVTTEDRPTRSETSVSLHQEVGLAVRYPLHRRVDLVFTLSAAVLLQRAAYFEQAEETVDGGGSARMVRLPVGPRAALGIAFGAI